MPLRQSVQDTEEFRRIVMAEIIPKVVLKVDRDRLEVTWVCYGCGEQNVCFIFSETLKDLQYEVKSVNKVSCISCYRTYEVD